MLAWVSNWQHRLHRLDKQPEANCWQRISQGDSWWWSRSRNSGRGLTIDVVLGVGLIRLVVVDHLNHGEQIILLQAGEAIGQLVHVDLCRLALLLGIGIAALLACAIGVVWDWTRSAEYLDKVRVWVLEGDDVLGLVAWLCEVEVVCNGVLSALLSSEEVNGHVELSPSLVLAVKRWLSES